MKSRLIRLLHAGALAALISALSSPADAQQDTMETTLDPITITAGVLPVQLRNATRTIDIIDARSLREAAPASLDDALRGLSKAFVQRRGPMGAQSDLSLRGGTFGQTLMMIDGFRVNDPQTGHHALQIPLPMAMIERIEVLPGHGSALLGADALGGAVNIVPALKEETRFGARIEGGSYGLRMGGIDAAYGGETMPSRSAIEYRANDGWRAGTDMSMIAMSHYSRVPLGSGGISLLAGYANRDFGAFDFYSPGRGIPSHEHVRSGYAALGGNAAVGPLQLRGTISYRDLRDRFQFDVRVPDKYINEHHTQVLGADLRGILPVSENAVVSVGLEASQDRILSSNLGDHERAWAAVSAAGQWQVAPWVVVDGGLRMDAYDERGPELNPTFGIRLRPYDRLTLRASTGRSFRLPTYSDLYYSDPVNRGSSSLRPESAWSTEVGLAWQARHDITMSTAVFHRDQRDLIDYVQFAADEPFTAMNFTEATVNGVEANLGWSASMPGWLDMLQLSYTMLSTRVDTRGAYRTRYAQSAPSQLLHIRIGGSLPGGLRYTLIAVAADQQTARDYGTIDARLRRAFGAVDVYLAADNLTNTFIEEFPGLPLPGRWIRTGAELRF